MDETPPLVIDDVKRMRQPRAIARWVTSILVAAIVGLLATAALPNALGVAVVAMAYLSIPLVMIHSALRRREIFPVPIGDPAPLVVTERELLFDGAPLISRVNVVSGVLAHAPSGVVVRLRSRDGRSISLLVPSLERGRALLTALGVDVTRATDAITAKSPFREGAIVLGGLGAFVGAIGLLAGSRDPSAMAIVVGVLGALVALVSFGAVFSPTKVTVGADGVSVRWLHRRRLIALSKIAAVEQMQGGVRIHRRDDRPLDLILARSALVPDMESTRLVERIREALDAQAKVAPAPFDASILERADLPLPAWFSRLREVLSVGTFRNVGLVADELWRVIEDAHAEPARRAAAAVALTGALDEPGRQRLRVVANASAIGKLRIALEAAADGDDPRLSQAMEEIEAADSLRLDGGATRPRR